MCCLQLAVVISVGKYSFITLTSLCLISSALCVLYLDDHSVVCSAEQLVINVTLYGIFYWL